MRLIDADDAIYELKRVFPIDDFKRIVRAISRTPTIDSVQVVRCKDCVYCWKFNDKFYLPKKDSLICINDCDVEVHADDFCAWGERRSE